MTSTLAALSPVAVVGDSIACGYGAEHSWVDVLEARAGREADGIRADDASPPSAMGADGPRDDTRPQSSEWIRVACPGARLEHLATAHTVQSVTGARTVFVAAGLNDLAGVGGDWSSPRQVYDLTRDFAERLAAARQVGAGDPADARCSESVGSAPAKVGERRVIVCTPILLDPDLAIRRFGMRVEFSDILELRRLLLAWGEELRADGSRPIAVLDMWPALAGVEVPLCDGIHPTTAGQDALADWVQARLPALLPRTLGSALPPRISGFW